MKKTFTRLGTLMVVVFLVSIVFNTYAQDWTKEKSGLYYVGSKGKVYIEPDYSAVAVYFKEDNLVKTTAEKFKSKFNTLKSSEEHAIELMDRKGMMLVKSSSQMKSIQTPEDRKEFLKSYGLDTDGAYEILPAFSDRGEKVFLTKRVAISLKDGFYCEDFTETLEKYGAKYQRKSIDGSFDVLTVENIENQFLLVQELHEMGVLNWGGPDFKTEIQKHADPLYQYQWHLNNTGGTSYNGAPLVNDIDIDAPEAWGITTGSSNITIGIIDDGLDYSHEDMPTPLTGYTPANNGDGVPSLTDDGHGMLVAGLIMAQHDNNLGGKGVAPGVNYFSVNIFAPNTSNTDVADGITWAVNQGADILSNSWGWGSCTYSDASVTSAFANAASNGRNGKGCLIFVASGNDFFDCVGYPANLTTVIAVGGMAGDADRSNFSNYGPALDICAPSDDNWTTGPSGDYGCPSTDRMGSLGWTNDNYYMYMGGTSGATPIVSGVASLVLSVNPALTKAEAENILLATAFSDFNAYNSNEFGAGMVNAYGAVMAAGGSADEEAPTTPTGLNASNIGSTSFDLSWNASTDNNAVSGYNIYLNGTEVASAAGTSTTVTGLVPSNTYSVRVSAYDAANNESAQSSAINVTTTEAVLNCVTTISSFPYAESFESNDGWTQITGDDGDWVRDASGTPSSGTGPSSAADGSYYMFLEASTNGSTGQIGSNATAILESDCFDLSAATAATFSFQYHMYGTSIGTLAIQLSVNDIDWTNLWTLSGDQGNDWYPVDINLDAYAGGTIKLRIVGTTGSSWSSDIAVDDLNFTISTGVDTEAPSVPTNLTSANISQTSFTLSWNASIDNVGVTSYDIFQDGSNIGSTANTSYNVTGLTANTTYAYTVKAKDAAGNISSASSALDVTTLEETPVNTPPVADAGGPYTADEGAAIVFDGTGSSDADGDALTYSWDFGDGSNGTGATPSHTYATAGSYIATLTVSDGTDSDQSTASVTVNSTGADLPMVSAISLTKSTAGPWTKVSGTVTITSSGQALSNAFVEGNWSGGSSNSVSGYTAADGTLALNVVKSRNTSSFTFTITNVTKAGYFWDTANSQFVASVSTRNTLGTPLIPEEFSAYPNPVTNGYITVAVPELENGARLVIYDINGSAKLVEQLTNVLTNISVQDLSSGVYILKVDGEDTPQRIIIK